MILPDVSYVELKTFVADIYCHHPHFGWSHLDIPQPRKLVSEEEDDCDYTVHWGAGHQGPAEAGIVPLGLVAAPTPALSDNSDCVLADSAEVGTVPLAEEAAIQSQAGVTSPVPEWVSEKLFVNSIWRKEGMYRVSQKKCRFLEKRP